MADVTVKQFATVVGIPVDRLLEQFTEAGITVGGVDTTVTEKQKLDLLAHLRKSHGDASTDSVAEPKKITLKRKTHSEIKMAGSTGGPAKTVSVEVRKKRTYVKRAAPTSETVAPPVVAPEMPMVEVPIVPIAVQDVVQTPIPVPTPVPVPVVAAVQPPPAPEPVPVSTPVVAAPLPKVETPAPERDPAPTVAPVVTAAPVADTPTAPSSTLPEQIPPRVERPERTDRAYRMTGNAPRSSTTMPSSVLRDAPPRPRPAEGEGFQRRTDAPPPRRTSDTGTGTTSTGYPPRRRPDSPTDRRPSDRPAGAVGAGTMGARTTTDTRPPRPAGTGYSSPGVQGPRRPPFSGAPGAPRPASSGGDANRPRPPQSSTPSSTAAKPKRRTDGPAAAAAKRPEADSARRRELESEAERLRRGDVSGADRVGRHRPKKGKSSKDLLVQRHGFSKPTAPMVRDVALPESISITDLAQKMSAKATDVIKVFFKMGMMVTINQVIDQETAALAVEEMGHTYKLLNENALEDELTVGADSRAALPRPPVVTIMGHVDHGKTSLLDYIRRTRVVAGEAGGITQHIGAYHVNTPKGVVTFLDTPGHAAFTAMRARGAKATDVVVLVVAADDGVMPQTIEAIQHARAANVPLVVAVNKMDKAGADPERVKSELSVQQVISEEWGGDALFAYVSAKSGLGVDELLDKILVQAEVLELRAPVDGPARGVVIESRLDKGRGPVATILVHSGTLRKGDILLSGREYGRVRAMFNESGQNIAEAGPSIPVEMVGLSGTARAGDEVIVVADERKAREIALFRQTKAREEQTRKPVMDIEGISKQFEAGQASVVNVVLKADVQGSAEAIVDALTRLSTTEVQVKIIANGVGGINESDVNLAKTSGALLIGFNVRADSVAKKLADEEGMKPHYYSIIYELIDDVKRAMIGMLKPEFKESIVGLAEVRGVFRSPKFGVVAGCMVVDGTVRRSNPVRVLRNHVVIFEGALDSLRRFKDDVTEVRAGTDCGIGVKNYSDIHEGDQIEVFERVQVERTL